MEARQWAHLVVPLPTDLCPEVLQWDGPWVLRKAVLRDMDPLELDHLGTAHQDMARPHAVRQAMDRRAALLVPMVLNRAIHRQGKLLRLKPLLHLD